MTSQRGVPLTELCCPTCGDRFPEQAARYELNPHYTREWRTNHSVIEPRGRPFITCKDGHQWTVKTLFVASPGAELEVLLDQYIGGGGLA